MTSDYLESPVIVNDLKNAKSVFIKEKFYNAETLQKIGEKLTEYKLTRQGCSPECVYDRNSNGFGINHKEFERKAFIFLVNACSYKRELKNNVVRITDVWKTTMSKDLMDKEDDYSPEELAFKKFLIEVAKMQELKARNNVNVIRRFHDIYNDDVLFEGDEDSLIIKTFGDAWFRKACFSTKTKYRRAFRDYRDFIKRRELYEC